MPKTENEIIDYNYLAQEIKKVSKSAHKAGIKLREMVAVCKSLSDGTVKDLSIRLKKSLANLTKRNPNEQNNINDDTYSRRK